MKVEKGNVLTVKNRARYLAIEDSSEKEVKCHKLADNEVASDTVFTVRFESIKLVEAKLPEAVEEPEEPEEVQGNDLNSEGEETTV